LHPTRSVARTTGGQLHNSCLPATIVYLCAPGKLCGESADLLKQAQHVQFGHCCRPGRPHPEPVDPAQLDRPTGCTDAREVAPPQLARVEVNRRLAAAVRPRRTLYLR
jgi:hypothetical protein